MPIDDIETDIPAPAPRQRGSERVEKIAELEPGEARFFPDITSANLSGSASNVKRKHPERVFVVRKATKLGVAGARIWRLDDVEADDDDE